MRAKIIGFHQDEFDDWAADLDCGHAQHMRHKPPFFNRSWVIDPKLRQEKIGYEVECLKCDHEKNSLNDTTDNKL